MEPALVPIPRCSVLEKVRPELYARGNFYAATDQRKTFLILSQKLVHTQYAIAELAFEEVGIASLYEAADPTHRTPKCGSFRIQKLPIEDATSWVAHHRRLYSHVYISTSNPRLWHILHPPEDEKVSSPSQPSDASLQNGN